MIRRYRTVLAVIGLVAAMGIAGQLDYEEEQRQTAQYCEMVAMWKESGGRAGWPAYDGEEVCRGTQRWLPDKGEQQ